MIWTSIKSFLSIEYKISHSMMLMALFVLFCSTSMNGLLLFSGNDPEPYKMYAVNYQSKVLFVTALADLNAYYEYHESDARYTKMPLFIGEMNVYGVACGMITPNMEIGEMTRLMKLVSRINENGCENIGTMD